MAREKIAQIWVAGDLFLTGIDTKLSQILSEALQLGESEPEILEAIEADLDAHGKEKKRRRLADKAWLESHTEALRGEGFAEAEKNRLAELRLEEGRPRMSASMVLVFLMVRGYWGSVSGQKEQDWIHDSVTIRSLLSRYGMKMPGRRTILDNVNAVSNTTRDLLLDLQLKKAAREDLDDFELAIIDSTAVSSSSAWPGESELLFKLLRRIDAAGKSLKCFGIEGWRRWQTGSWLARLKKMDFEINASIGKRRGRRTRRRLYGKIYKTMDKALSRVKRERERHAGAVKQANLMPTLRERLDGIWQGMEQDIEASERVLRTSRQRVEEEKKVPATERYVSISDQTASVIVKGGREPTFGYKPQLVRSGKGFITSVIVEQGNISDSRSLLPGIQQHSNRTGVIPRQVSADDGYASAEGRTQLLDLGAQQVSFSGGTGKSVMPQEEWEDEDFLALRNKRSSVESVIFVLKDVFELDQLRRRGLEAVRGEILEKLIAHNFWRLRYLADLRRKRAA